MIADNAHFTFPFNGLVWRLEIDPVTATLFAEIRNEQDKQVSFASIGLASGKLNFTDLTTDERWLTGMECAHNGVLLLHHYESASSPIHKGIMAIDGRTGQLLWSDYSRGFDHLSINGPVMYDQRIQPRKFFVADIKTGERLHAYDTATDTEADLSISIPDIIDGVVLSAELGIPAPFGNVAHNLYLNQYRIVSLHALNNTQLTQTLYIFENDKPVFNDLLNAGIQKLQPEAFIVHNNHLIYLKNKTELNVINL
jgi:hypothetical protein